MIKEYQIEETIIAYFDGRLSDGDSAELLHRVSVSPEIREIFQEHEAMRVMAYSASRNVIVPSYLEESVFARISALDEAGREKAVPVAFWTLPRISTLAGAAALVVLGLFALWRTSDTIVNSARNQISNSQPVENTRAGSVAPNFGENPSATNIAGRLHTSEANGTTEGIVHTNQRASDESGGLMTDSAPVINSPFKSEGDPAIQIIPAAFEANRISGPSLSQPHPTLRSFSRLPGGDNTPSFEIGIATDMTPAFNEPANVVTQAESFSNLASEFALRAAYAFDSRNQIGLKIARVGFPDLQLAVSQPISQNGYTLVVGSMSKPLIGFSEEAFYKHRIPLNDELVYVTLTAGGGFYKAGTLLSGELGLEIPIGDNLAGGVSLILSRIHRNGSLQAVLRGNEPVIYDGPNIYNTLAGRIEFGLSYSF
jgi:hypothetical protein